jgi:hypothetical protein
MQTTGELSTCLSRQKRMLVIDVVYKHFQMWILYVLVRQCRGWNGEGEVAVAFDCV